MGDYSVPIASAGRLISNLERVADATHDHCDLRLAGRPRVRRLARDRAVRPRLRLAATALLGSELAVSRRLRTGRSAATVDIRPQRAPHRTAPARLHGPPVAG